MNEVQSASVQSPSSDSVQVSVRVRPLNAREQAAASNSNPATWQISTSSITQCVNNKPVPANSFSFDHIFQRDTSNQHIFQTIAKPVVKSSIEGINGVIFAYGQTAAGKTYTMLGTEQDPGITRRSISAVFDLIASYSERQFLLRASYIEIYNEIIRDLLLPSNENLKIHEDIFSKQVFVAAREEVVTSVEDVMQIISAGEAVRAVGETNMNDRSSRSHTIFTLKIESRQMSCSDAEEDAQALQNDGVAIRASTLSLVDLAGSERASFSRAQGIRLVEGGHINKSLLTLGTVINKLSSGESRNSSHIPYRDSKLTRLLQPALGGNARTAIICAVTPAILHMDETLSTLKFASRAKKVTNHASTNEFLDDRAKLRRAEKQIISLKFEIEGFQSRRYVSLPSNLGQEFGKADNENRIRYFKKKFEELSSQLTKQEPISELSNDRKRSYAIISMRTPLATALDLQVRSIKRTRSISTNEKPRDGKTDEELTQMRLKLFEAERDKRHAFEEIEFERKAMAEEVEVLITSSEQASRERLVAERECEEALTTLSRAQATSLVDEMVSEAMATSSLKSSLKQAGTKIAVLEGVRKEKDVLSMDMQLVQKELSGFRKREKRGIGPAMKEARAEHFKRTEAENKVKSTRKQLQAMKTEKVALIREKSSMERRLKALQTENERHRNHTEKAQTRIEKVVSEAKKEFQTTLSEKEEELEANRNEANATTTRLEKLEKEIEILAERNSKLSAEVAVCSGDRDRIRDKKNQTEKELIDVKELLKSLTTDYTTAAENLSQARLELQVEASTRQIAEKGRNDTEIELAEKIQTNNSLEIELIECEKVNCSLRDVEEEGKQENLVLRDEFSSLLSVSNEFKVKLQSAVEAKEVAEKEMEKSMVDSSKSIHELQKSLEHAEEQESIAFNIVEDCKSESKSLRVDIASLEKQNMDLEEKCCSLRMEVSKVEIPLGKLGKNGMKEAFDNSDCYDVHGKGDALVSGNNDVNTRVEDEKVASSTGGVEKFQEEDQESRNSAWERENAMLREKMELLFSETQTRTREIHRITNVLNSRDNKTYEMGEKLNQSRKNVESLKDRVSRRDKRIEEMQKRLQVQGELLNNEEHLLAEFRNAERILETEMQNQVLQEERDKLLNRMDVMEKERDALQKETWKLRSCMKSRDGERIKETIKRREVEHAKFRENVRRKALDEIYLNSKQSDSDG